MINQNERRYFRKGKLLLHVNVEQGLQAELTDASTQRLKPDAVIGALINRNRVMRDSTDILNENTLRPERVHVIGSDTAMVEVALDDNTEDGALLTHVRNIRQRMGSGNGLAQRTNDRLTPSIDAIAPDWYAPGCPAQIGTGGPGARPVPYTGSTTTIPYKFRLPADLPATGGELPVEVAILDTAPPQTLIDGAYTAGHALLATMYSKLRISYAAANGIPLPAEDEIVEAHDYVMFDHGLFAAGIIHSIAPEATLHLVQVLNDHGVGSALGIWRGLAQVAASLPAGALLINCSLVLATPSESELTNTLWANWGSPAEIQAAIEATFATLDAPLRWIEANRRFANNARQESATTLKPVIAAAGNDWQAGQPRPPARFPARSDFAFGIGAMKMGVDEPATYSCISDNPSNIGLMTCGGDALPTGFSDPDKGILGIYLGTFPGNGSTPANTTQWARWSGTSFATPVVSGTLARLLSCGDALPAAWAKIWNASTLAPTTNERMFHAEQG